MLTTAEKLRKQAAASVANPEDICLIMDLRLEKQGEPKELIATICRKLGVSREMLAGVVASPPCVSYTKLDHVNRERGNNYREANKPYPPRKLDGSLKAQLKRKIAQEHDDMVMSFFL